MTAGFQIQDKWDLQSAGDSATLTEHTDGRTSCVIPAVVM